VLGCGPAPPGEGAILGVVPHRECNDSAENGYINSAIYTSMSCAKTAEPIEMPFGCGLVASRRGPRNHALGGAQIATGRGTLGRHNWSRPNLPTVYILNAIRLGQQRRSLWQPVL